MDSLNDSRSLGRFFRGTYEHSITRQGRIILPSRFREVLEERNCGRLVMARYPHRLDVFPEDEWQAFEERLQLLDQDDDRIFSYVHYLQSNQLEADVDKQGRILVPPKWRSSLGLDGDLEVVLLGAKTHFEIWPKPRFAEAYRQWEEGFAGNRGYVAEMHREKK